MEQSQKLLQKRNYLIAGIVALLVIGYFVFQGQEASAPQTSEEQASGENTNGEQIGSETNQNTNSSPNEDQTAADGDLFAGNVSATGTLRASDNPSRGNLVLDSNRGKIYVQTSRDFSSLLGKEVALDAEGTINSFVFLSFLEAGAVAGTETDTSAVGGGESEEPSTVRLSGTLAASDNEVKGNYIINSSVGKIYLRSQHDRSSWIGTNVELTANGTINSFTGAVLKQK
jgi:hypothetical protein